MTLTLTNNEFSENGIFGVLDDAEDMFALETLQRSYPTADGTWYAKLPPGSYTCKRGFHRLKNMIDLFETFEVEKVPGHTGILFHTGNENKESEGCILVGSLREGNRIMQSRKAFQSFMDHLKNVDEFELIVI